MTTPRYRIAVAVNGGLGSTCAYHTALSYYAPEEVVAVFVNFGQPTLTKEVVALDGLQIPYRYISIPFFCAMVGQPPTVEAPHIAGRDAVLAAFLAPLAETVWLGSTADERYGEGRVERIRAWAALSAAMTETLGRHSLITGPHSLVSPVQMLTEVQQESPVNFAAALLHTVSCDAPTTRRCGNCIPCITRWLNLYAIGQDTTTLLDRHPITSPATATLFARYAKAVLLSSFTHYSKERIRRHWTTYMHILDHYQCHDEQAVLGDVWQALNEAMVDGPSPYDTKALHLAGGPGI